MQPHQLSFQEWHGTHVASIAVGQMVQLNTTSNYYRKDMTAGSWGGTCMCPDGAVYAVADNLDECASLACEGGIPSKCERMNRPERLNMKVTCDVNMGGNITASGMAPHANLIFYEVSPVPPFVCPRLPSLTRSLSASPCLWGCTVCYACAKRKIGGFAFAKPKWV